MALLPAPEKQAEFLSQENLSPLLNKDGYAVFKVTEEPKMGRNGVNVRGTIGKSKELFILTMKVEFNDYALVANAFGRETADWVGQKIRVGLRPGMNSQGEKTSFTRVVGVE